MTIPLYLNSLGIINPLGNGKSQVADNLFRGAGDGLHLDNDLVPGQAVLVGRVSDDLPDVETVPSVMNSQNNRLLAAVVAEIRDDIEISIEKYGRHRIGVVVGTSTASILENENAVDKKIRTGVFPADFSREHQGLYHGAEFIAKDLNLSGPAFGISTACTSSAKVFASARRLISSNLCDAVIAGGADSLCKLTLNGFNALEAISPERCQPFSANRSGINIGEGSALFLVSREAGPIRLSGIGESSDAHHISAPDPEGTGALAAMTAALHDSGLTPENIDYLNAHGTATVMNDAAEAKAISRCFASGVPVSSTKPLTGHMLGAAGANEAAFLWLALQPEYAAGRLPPHCWDGVKDANLPEIDLVELGSSHSATGIQHMMSSSFAFGGNNISLVLSNGQMQ